MKIGIIGTGAYGLALALICQNNKCQVSMWTKFEEEKKQLDEKRQDYDKLPGITIPKEIVFTNNIEDVIIGKDIIIIAVPAAFVNDIALEMAQYVKENQTICIASKGIENNTCSFLVDVINRYVQTENIAVISGPSFAIDIANCVPIGLTLATKNSLAKKNIKNALENNYIKLRVTDDLIGVEICGAIKNVIALAAGMLDGMNLPESTKAMFITESLHDIKELIDGLGGDKKTILSFAGFGDLLLTCTSTKSRNFCFGRLIGQNMNRQEIEDYKQKHTIEGLYTLQSIHQLISDKKIDIPIVNLIYDIVFHDNDCKELLKFLITK